MPRSLPALVLCGCGSFGLDLAELGSGRLVIQPAGDADFGELVPNRQSAVLRFTLTTEDETGGSGVNELWIEGDTGDFAITPTPEVPRMLEASDHMGIAVRFRPTESRAFAGELLAATLSGELVRIPLLGVGCENDDGNNRCDP